MMKNTVYFITFALFLIIISSCNNCKDPACPKLTNEEASWFPYENYDTLVFYNIINDSSLYFPFINYGNSSNLYTPSNGDECNKFCLAGMVIYSHYSVDNIEVFFSAFVINKVDDDFYAVISPSGGTLVNYFDPFNYFDINYSTELESLIINGQEIESVYKYTCYPEQEDIAETYVKKGIGLVKIVFRNGQEFELVEHRKAK